VCYVGADGEVDQRACGVAGLELLKGGRRQTCARLFLMSDVLLFLCSLRESPGAARLVLFVKALEGCLMALNT
jgi:hypothetical protein